MPQRRMSTEPKDQPHQHVVARFSWNHPQCVFFELKLRRVDHLIPSPVHLCKWENSRDKYANYHRHLIYDRLKFNIFIAFPWKLLRSASACSSTCCSTNYHTNEQVIWGRQWNLWVSGWSSSKIVCTCFPWKVSFTPPEKDVTSSNDLSDWANSLAIDKT